MSTLQSLVGQATTCSTPGDAASYWTPMLYQSGYADFFNSWNQSALVSFIQFCLHTGKVCGTLT